jgi:hypothetical protein
MSNILAADINRATRPCSGSTGVAWPWGSLAGSIGSAVGSLASIARRFLRGLTSPAADAAPDACAFVDTQACWTHLPAEPVQTLAGR